MARRRDDGLFDMYLDAMADLFTMIPPWASIPIGFLLGGLTLIVFNSQAPKAMRELGFLLAALVAFPCFAGGFIGWLDKRKRTKFLKSEIDLTWVRSLSWREFERQVAAAYQNRGYETELLGGNGPDGGVDIKLTKGGKITLVQCKHWKAWKVGVRPVRELFGVMAAQAADAGILICSGKFSGEAKYFAEGKPIELIDQTGFIELARQFQRELRKTSSTSNLEAEKPVRNVSSAPIPLCPLCERPMVLRTARKGPTVGQKFYGCSAYPACNGTRSLEK